MAKILLVEDDQNLSEIYNARLSAEGYEVVSAANGEDALAVASQEKPDLVISDVMMPRVSGFEMLDILKHTDGMQGVKVIMLTALGQDNDRSKASELGADRYLVKSQVTLEDIVTTAKELLGDTGEAEPDLNLQAAQAGSGPSTFAADNGQAVTPAPQPVQNTVPTSNNELTPAPAPQPQFQTSTPPVSEPVDSPVAPQPVVAAEPTPQPVSPAPEQAPVQPAYQATNPDIPESAAQPVANEPLEAAEPIAQEEAELNAQLGNAGAIEDLGDSTELNNPTQATPEQSNNMDSPTAIQPSESTTTQATETESNGAQPQAPVVPSSETMNPQPDNLAPATAPETMPSQPTDASQPAANPNHDELLASALKELESNDPNQVTVAPQPTPNDSTPTAPADDEQKTERKVILPPEQSNARPDINDLLSKEENQQAAAAPAPVNPLNQVISPNTPGAEPQNLGGIDPSSISL